MLMTSGSSWSSWLLGRRVPAGGRPAGPGQLEERAGRRAVLPGCLRRSGPSVRPRRRPREAAVVDLDGSGPLHCERTRAGAAAVFNSFGVSFRTRIGAGIELERLGRPPTACDRAATERSSGPAQSRERSRGIAGEFRGDQIGAGLEITTRVHCWRPRHVVVGDAVVLGQFRPSRRIASVLPLPRRCACRRSGVEVLLPSRLFLGQLLRQLHGAARSVPA